MLDKTGIPKNGTCHAAAGKLKASSKEAQGHSDQRERYCVSLSALRTMFHSCVLCLHCSFTSVEPLRFLHFVWSSVRKNKQNGVKFQNWVLFLRLGVLASAALSTYACKAFQQLFSVYSQGRAELI